MNSDSETIFLDDIGTGIDSGKTSDVCECLSCAGY